MLPTKPSVASKGWERNSAKQQRPNHFTWNKTLCFHSALVMLPDCPWSVEGRRSVPIPEAIHGLWGTSRPGQLFGITDGVQQILSFDHQGRRDRWETRRSSVPCWTVSWSAIRLKFKYWFVTSKSQYHFKPCDSLCPYVADPPISPLHANRTVILGSRGSVR